MAPQEQERDEEQEEKRPTPIADAVKRAAVGGAAAGAGYGAAVAAGLTATAATTATISAAPVAAGAAAGLGLWASVGTVVNAIGFTASGITSSSAATAMLTGSAIASGGGGAVGCLALTALVNPVGLGLIGAASVAVGVKYMMKHKLDVQESGCSCWVLVELLAEPDKFRFQNFDNEDNGRKVCLASSFSTALFDPSGNVVQAHAFQESMRTAWENYRSGQPSAVPTTATGCSSEVPSRSEVDGLTREFPAPRASNSHAFDMPPQEQEHEKQEGKNSTPIADAAKRAAVGVAVAGALYGAAVAAGPTAAATATATMSAAPVAVAAAAGATLWASVVPVVHAIGFTVGGIASGSAAAGMMSAAAIANGGGVASGSLVAVLQSVGVIGLATPVGLGILGGTVVIGVGVSYMMAAAPVAAAATSGWTMAVAVVGAGAAVGVVSAPVASALKAFVTKVKESGSSCWDLATELKKCHFQIFDNGSSNREAGLARLALFDPSGKLVMIYCL